MRREAIGIPEAVLVEREPSAGIPLTPVTPLVAMVLMVRLSDREVSLNRLEGRWWFKRKKNYSLDNIYKLRSCRWRVCTHKNNLICPRSRVLSGLYHPSDWLLQLTRNYHPPLSMELVLKWVFGPAAVKFIWLIILKKHKFLFVGEKTNHNFSIRNRMLWLIK